MDREVHACKPFLCRRIAHRLATGVTVFDEDPLEGGLSVRQWIDLWLYTHDRGRRTEWPDGGTLLAQPNIAVLMLDLVGEEMLKEAQAKTG
jgi:hypothetical protein